MHFKWKPIAYVASLLSSKVAPIPSVPAVSDPNNGTDVLEFVDPMIGVAGPDPNHSGGMIPSVGTPFGMTRWVAQTRENYVSMTPYNITDTKITGFQATHQPAIWMGESGTFVVVPGAGAVKPGFEKRGMRVVKGSEKSAVDWYEVELVAEKGVRVKCEMTATSRVGHIRFTFTPPGASSTRSSSSAAPSYTPYIIIQSSRSHILRTPASPHFNSELPIDDPSNIEYPLGSSKINPLTLTMSGHNEERQDAILTPVSNRKKADGFKAYYYAKFDSVALPERGAKSKDANPPSPPVLRFHNWGTATNTTLNSRSLSHEGKLSSGYVVFPPTSKRFSVELRVGVSFISIGQAMKNVDDEIPDGKVIGGGIGMEGMKPSGIENTRKKVGELWRESVGRVVVGLSEDVGGDDDEEVIKAAEEKKKVLLTAISRTLQYPYEQHESGRYYSGYTDSLHNGESYTGYSIWDTYRAAWAWQLLFAPDRIPGMVKSMLQDFKQGGWLPMWKNIVETNIMIATHADSLIAEAVIKGFGGKFDVTLALDAVLKDAREAPVGDGKWEYADREEGVDYEVRAGLNTVYAEKGWVADDLHSESASRTLGYSYDDYAASRLLSTLLSSDPSLSSKHPHFSDLATQLLTRSLSHRELYNPSTGFLEARNADGSFAGPDRGWTEGDKWAYTFDVVHDVDWLIDVKGGKREFVKFLDEFFDEGHSDHSNEPSHHIPYLYALAGAASRTQALVRKVASENYNTSANGLSGNEDCGQMSAWYIFTALGFYPVNPVSGTYVIGSPFFPYLSVQLPQASRPLTVLAPGALTKPYVKSVSVDGVQLDVPVLSHEMIKDGAVIIFEMSDVEEKWGSETVWEDGSKVPEKDEL